MEEVVSIKHEPEWVSKNEEEGPSSSEPVHELELEDGMSLSEEGEDTLIPIAEVIIKEELWDPTSDNPLMIAKKEENDAEVDTYSRQTEDSQDRSCEDQTRSSEVLRSSKCQECNKMFSTISELLQHKKIHIAGKKCLACPVCLRVFKHASNLSRHKHVHTGVKNYECKLCDKKFSQRSNLILHESVHTGERPYSCRQCSRTFTWESNLSQHIQAHHNKPHPCVVLGEEGKFPPHILEVNNT